MAPMKVISVIFCSGGMHHEKRYLHSQPRLETEKQKQQSEEYYQQIQKEKEKAAPLF